MATHRCRTLTLLALLLTLSVGAVTAQATSALRTGDSVRVQRPTASQVEGTLRELTPTHLFVDQGESGATLLIPREEALQIDVRVRRWPWRKGAVIGALIGGGGLALAGLASGDDVCSGWCWFTYTAEEKAAMGLVAGGVMGAGLGLAVAAHASTRVWKPVSPQKVWISPEVSSDGGLGVRIRLPVR